MFNEIVLASNNAGKLREFKAFFEPYGVQVIPQGELNVPSVQSHIALLWKMLWPKRATPAWLQAALPWPMIQAFAPLL